MVSKKICVIGQFAVGKTSLVRRYVLNEFSHDYQATLGVNIYKYSDTVDGPSGKETVLNQIIWDIEGGDTNPEKTGTYIQGAAGALIVGDITRAETIAAMAEHARLFQSLRPGRPFAFALNKIDLLDEPPPQETDDSLTKEFGADVVRTSAAEGTAVPELFRRLGSRILEIGA